MVLGHNQPARSLKEEEKDRKNLVSNLGGWFYECHNVEMIVNKNHGPNNMLAVFADLSPGVSCLRMPAQRQP
jgi:hypothetical protein